MAKTKAGKSYLSLTLADKTGQIEAKAWELGIQIQPFEQGDFVKMDADVQTYGSDLQLRVIRARKSLPGEYEPRDYMPCSDKDPGELWDGVRAMAESVSDPFLAALLGRVLLTPENEAAFKAHSAGKQMHHAYMGGLAEHTLSVAETCDFLCGRYAYVNRDLCVTGALLHDIGKLREISPFPENDYTDDGQLIGHIVMTAIMIDREASAIEGFPPRLKSLLIHIILSHHGEYAFGSPELPKTIEAMILHVADNADAKLKMFETAYADARGSQWTAYHKTFARALTKSEW
ncbi:MAG: HD domain-containing protein [Clostridiales bacterium]|jgi:3'-5' exoribonuclease|nr:HD domain-containing protein [Clostridiales bacterium]